MSTIETIVSFGALGLACFALGIVVATVYFDRKHRRRHRAAVRRAIQRRHHHGGSHPRIFHQEAE